VTVFQAFFTDRDKLTFIAGGSAAFCKPKDGRIPQNILFAFHNTLDIGLHIIVFMNRDRLFERTDSK
jgi:hypothetical protein